MVGIIIRIVLYLIIDAIFEIDFLCMSFVASLYWHIFCSGNIVMCLVSYLEIFPILYACKWLKVSQSIDLHTKIK